MLPEAKIVIARRDKLENCFGCYRYLLSRHPYVHDFGDLARSKMLLERMPWPTIADRALHTYRNALIGIHTFGGCAISYEEMVDPAQTAWLQAGHVREGRAAFLVRSFEAVAA